MDEALEKLFSLTGHTALVTGSSRGIGREIALTLARAGATVILHGSRESEKLREAAEHVKRIGGRVECVTADLTDDKAAAALPDACRALGLEVDILVLNASVQEYRHVTDYEPEEFAREFLANVGAAFRLVKEFSPAMRRKHWGRIVCVGSVNQLRPATRLSIYSATKAALENFTVCCAKEFAADGVTVNNLVPGVILTDRNEKILRNEAFRETVRSSIPLGRFGSVSDMAGAALLLCGEAGAYITGIELPVTGGMHL